MTAYEQFIRSKSITAPPAGIDPGTLGDVLFPFQRDIVAWALRRGRACIFADCGLGKTPMQLEWARRVVEHTGGRVLILAPLAVAAQTVREATKFGIDASYCRSQDAVKCGITVANYEMLPRFEPESFVGVVLDESSILKAFDGKTRTMIIGAFDRTPYRLACTATPAPNDFMELGSHSEFVGAMTRSEMLSMFFCHDGGSTQDWRLKGHAETAFWEWVCSWAVMIRRPSDLGYSNGGFTLPPLNIVEHVVGVSHKEAWSSGLLFKMEAVTLAEQRAARRATIDTRVARCAEIAGAVNRQFIAWCELNAEGDALTAAIPGAVQVSGADDADVKERTIIDFLDGKIRVLVSKGSIFGFGMNLQCCSDVAFVGLSHSYERFYQTVRRCWRFGQTREVNCHVITAETEGRVVESIRRKEADAARMAEAMAAHMRSIQTATINGTGRTSTKYEPQQPMDIPPWLAMASAMEEQS